MKIEKIEDFLVSEDYGDRKQLERCWRAAQAAQRKMTCKMYEANNKYISFNEMANSILGGQ